MPATGLRGKNNQPASPPYSNGPYLLKSTSLDHSSEAITASGALATNGHLFQIDSSGAAVAITQTQPDEGRLLILHNKNTNDFASHSFTLTSKGTLDGSASQATFGGASRQTLALYGVANDRYIVVENIGSVNIA